MITIEDLKAAAALKGISLRNAEKDYLLDVCLLTISRIGKGLVFKGGTSLFKYHSLNRFSEDLDFVQLKRKLDARKIGDDILRSARSIGINSRIGEVERYQKELNYLISFNGPLYDGRKESANRVTFNISLRERPQNTERKMYIPPYKEIPAFELIVLREDEILAEKIRAIMTREKPRDIYDLWFLLKKGVGVDLKLVNKKLKIYGMKFDRKEFDRKVEEKKGMWKRDLSGLIIGQLPRFGDISREIEEILNSIL